ncbi:MAG TPA: LTA synthase family protein [Tissierellaceae bacterium]|nr:LTA synthase family protein [Tissierellaceae bacterium]
MKRIKELLWKYKTNITLIILIIGGIFNDLVLRSLTVGGNLYWKPVLSSISVILFISILALFLSYKNKNRVYIGLSIILGLVNGMNYLYYKHYNSFLSFSLVTQLEMLKELQGTISSTLDFKVFVFSIPTIILILFIKKIKNTDYFEYLDKHHNNTSVLKSLSRPLAIGLLSFAIVFSTLTSTDMSRIAKQWNRPYLVEQLGIYSYTIADFVKNVAASNQASAVSNEEINSILENLIEDNLEKETNEEYKDIFKGRDVYLIHYESAESFAMNEELPGGYITPFLNQLAEEGLFFNNFYPQHSVGTSSDSEFTLSTSLLPINNGTVFMTHSDREFLSFPKLLKEQGYYTMGMHGNNGDFWNRNTMYRTLGYDKFYSQGDYIIDEEIGLGLSDVSFFKQSVEKIKNVKEEQEGPIMANLITLTNHYPFDDIDKYGEFDVGHLEDTSIGNYFKSYHYADQALESFVKQMDDEGLLDNAVIVLYGDHHAQIPNKDYTSFYNYNEDEDSYYTEGDPEYIELNTILKRELRRTPFIIWSKDQKINDTIDTPTGMIDIVPTLGNMIGVSHPYQLGRDVTAIDDNTVIFPDGDWINDEYYYSASNSQYYNFDNEIVEETSELSSITDMADKQIEISNSIIQSDLIRKFHGLKKEKE